MTTRRNFITGAAACMAGAVLPVWAAAGKRPQLVLGVLSDIHIHLSSPHSIRAFRETLQWYAARKVDAVTITGDLTDFGQLEELKTVAAVWREVFPNNRRPDGGAIVPLFIAGNHDLGRSDVWKRNLPRSATKEQLEAHWKTTWRADPKGVWEAAFGTPWEPISIKEVKGFKFVLCHFTNEPQVDAFLTAHADELSDATRPFFYMQHCPMNDTIYSGYSYNRNHPDYARHEALKKFPHAVALTGDSHYSFADDRFIYQGDFTAINCASDHYVAMRFNKYENGGATAGWLKGRAMQMKSDGYDFTNRQGMVFRLYDDHFDIERWDFQYRERLTADITVPYVRDAASPKPFTKAVRERLYGAPEFPKGASLAFTPVYEGKNRAGKPTRQFDVIFPAALALDPMKRALEYKVTFGRVEVEEAKGGKDQRSKVKGQTEDDNHHCLTSNLRPLTSSSLQSTVRYLTPRGFAHGLSRQAPGERMTFAVDEMPAGRAVAFTVRAVGCWGKESAPLTGVMERK